MEKYSSAFSQINKIVKHDAGGRGLSENAPNPDLGQLCRELMGGETFFIVTGFPVLAAGKGETDGPGGGANIARALLALEKRVVVISDFFSGAPVKAACDFYAPKAEYICLEKDSNNCMELLHKYKPSHVIALERPGKAKEHFYSMRGEVIDECLCDTEALFSGSDAVTIGVGDGGNELGMGGLRDIISQCVKNGEHICAQQAADIILPAGISNWWGWGICAALSLAAGKPLLPDRDMETELLRRVIATGAVDGMSKVSEMKVDGLSLEDNLAVLDSLHKVVRQL